MKITGLPTIILAAVGLFSSGQAAHAAEADNRNLIAYERTFDGGVVALGAGNVADGLGPALTAKFQELAAKQPLKGVVLDLRFARGPELPAAAAAADLFLLTEQPLASVAGRTLKSTAKKSAFTLPVVVLVNRETSGAAELLAALLREHRVAMLVGSRSAGGVSATLASGVALPADGLEPDIAETVSLADERVYFANAYAEIPAVKPTNAPTVSANKSAPRINEAELVRRQREGQARDEDPPLASQKIETSKTVVRDPVLARALDLLKGLAVARQARAL